MFQRFRLDESVQELPAAKIKPTYPSNVCVIIPAINEEKNIGDVLNRLNEIGYGNVLVIDGFSRDGTLKVAAACGAKTVLQNGQGKGQAVRQALSNNYLDADFLVIMDADGSMSPDEVPRFVEALKNGADVVKGSRFLTGGDTFDITHLRRIGNTLMTSVVNFFWASNYTDICYGFVAFNKEAVENLSPLLEANNFEIETEMFIKAKMLGLNVVEIPSTEYARKNGKSNLHSFRDGFKILRIIFNCLIESLAVDF